MHHHWDLKLARERLCKEAKLRICNMTLGFNHTPNYKTFHYPRIDQSIDAVIYVTVVFVLFAAIVLLLVSTGCHRYQASGQSGSSGEKRQLVVRFEDGGASQEKEAPMEPV